MGASSIERIVRPIWWILEKMWALEEAKDIIIVKIKYSQIGRIFGLRRKGEEEIYPYLVFLGIGFMFFLFSMVFLPFAFLEPLLWMFGNYFPSGESAANLRTIAFRWGTINYVILLLFSAINIRIIGHNSYTPSDIRDMAIIRKFFLIVFMGLMFALFYSVEILGINVFSILSVAGMRALSEAVYLKDIINTDEYGFAGLIVFSTVILLPGFIAMLWAYGVLTPPGGR